MADGGNTARLDVVLVNMPFAPADAPSLGLTLLAETLKQQGMTVRVLYPNIAFSRRLGHDLHHMLALNHFTGAALLGEWIFSRLVCPTGSVADYVTYLHDRFPHDMAANPDLAEDLPRLVQEAHALVESVAEQTVALAPRVIGFSSCFHQHLASLAAAQRIKQLLPGGFVVLGGANCNGPMGPETFKRFPFLDALVSGPGEIALPALVRRVLDGGDLRMSGVYLRHAGNGDCESHAPEPNLDDLPFPDYSDFFAAFGDGPAQPDITIESSRGCWWGQKHHCVFCSENANSMRYRCKSPERFLQELRWLTANYPQCRVRFTDEILHPRIIAEVMPHLAGDPVKAGMFTSVKANLRRDEVAALAAAGFDCLQPGIESLNDDILGPMRKGVTAIRNVQLLKLCAEHGIAVSWSILTGFPHDQPDAYDHMAVLMPLLMHLSPPHTGPVSLQRFSPLTREAESFGMTAPRPSASYGHIYPFPPDSIARLAYRFSAHHPNEPQWPRWRAKVMDIIQQWQETASQSVLFHQDDGHRLFVCDTRPMAQRFLHVLDGDERLAYLACDTIVPSHAVAARMGDGAAAALARLHDDGLLMEDKGLYLALGCRLNMRVLPPPQIMERFMAAKAAA